MQNEQLTADRSNFWKVVDRTKPGKLYLFSESELRDCQDYFLKVQSDPTVRANELIMAAERLTLIRSEIDVRHGDAKYRQAQRLAWWAIGLATVSLTGAIAFAVAQFLTKPPTRENWPGRCQLPRRSPLRHRALHQTLLSHRCTQSWHQQARQQQQRRGAPGQNTAANAAPLKKQTHTGQSKGFSARSSHRGRLKLPLPFGDDR